MDCFKIVVFVRDRQDDKVTFRQASRFARNNRASQGKQDKIFCFSVSDLVGKMNQQNWGVDLGKEGVEKL
jgi:hypothetical protein